MKIYGLISKSKDIGVFNNSLHKNWS